MAGVAGDGWPEEMMCGKKCVGSVATVACLAGTIYAVVVLVASPVLLFHQIQEPLHCRSYLEQVYHRLQMPLNAPEYQALDERAVCSSQWSW